MRTDGRTDEREFLGPQSRLRRVLKMFVYYYYIFYIIFGFRLYFESSLVNVARLLAI